MASNKQIRFSSYKIRWRDFKRIFMLNIGTILFGCLFIYIVISIVLYYTSAHITSYQVVAGPLARNETYTGLVLHSDQVVAADAGGYVTYYAREGGKVSASAIVYSLGAQQVQQAAQALTKEDMSMLRALMSEFSYGFQSSSFGSTYNFKYELGGSILQCSMDNQEATMEATQGADEGSQAEAVSSSVTMGGQTLVRASGDGIILYSEDGYEDTTVDNFTEASFSQQSYLKESLKTKDSIEAGTPVYTLVSGEDWNLVIPLSDKQASSLADRTTIKVRFLKDNVAQNGEFSIIERDGEKYGNIEFSSGLIRYAGERFLDIELVANVESGLKIPLTSVTNKDFYKIPLGYKTVEGDDGEAGFRMETGGKKKGDKAGSEFVSAVIYAQDETSCYVDTSVFPEGTVLLKPDSNDHYVVEETAPLEGAYCINEGYAVFRVINILDQNEEFCIVEKGTAYGLAQYDHIILDASQAKEEDIIY